MTKDPIDRQAAIDVLHGYFDGMLETDTVCPSDLYGSFEVIPSVDAVPVIRCKDCKHLQKWRSEESAKRFGQIYECARNVFDCPKPEDFCSHAERRE